MITGSFPPDVCGVGDYTFCLTNSLKTKGIKIEIITNQSWRIANSGRICNNIKKVRPDIIHVQYPTIGYGSGLAPQALSLRFPCIVTLHEISLAHLLRRISLFPFSIRTKHIIFTSSFERNYALRYAPWIKSFSSVIPIGSNISVGSNNLAKSNLKEIVYFGLIRPNKGLEDVITLASLLKNNSLNLVIRIIGSTDKKCLDYLEKLKADSVDLPVIWELGLPMENIAELLSESVIGYVPYPDGASERRGSLLALLANGVATITTRGSQTPLSLTGVVEFIKSPEEALRSILKLLTDQKSLQDLITKGREYAANFAWDSIASKHIEIYKQMLSGNFR